MITLEDNENNLLVLAADDRDFFMNRADFFAEFTSRFEKWGHISLVEEESDHIFEIHVADANPIKAVHYDNWVQDFLDLSKDTETNFIVQFVPYVNAYNDMVSYIIEDGEIVSQSGFSVGN